MFLAHGITSWTLVSITITVSFLAHSKHMHGNVSVWDNSSSILMHTAFMVHICVATWVSMTTLPQIIRKVRGLFINMSVVIHQYECGTRKIRGSSSHSSSCHNALAHVRYVALLFLFRAYKALHVWNVEYSPGIKPHTYETWHILLAHVRYVALLPLPAHVVRLGYVALPLLFLLLWLYHSTRRNRGTLSWHKAYFVFNVAYSPGIKPHISPGIKPCGSRMKRGSFLA